MKKREILTKNEVIEGFREHFKVAPGFLVRTPGRVNLMGDHTDYNGGFVLPMTIDKAVWMGVRQRGDGVVRIYSVDYEGECRFDVHGELKKDQNTWFEYIKGCAWALLQKNFPLSGFDAVLMGDVPQGSGLSSSAALEVTSLLVFAELGGFELSATDIARLGQEVENQWLGLGSKLESKFGVTDQLICAAGQADKALLIDCNDLEYRPLDLPEGTVAAVLDTAAHHSVASAVYNERQEQCQAACKILGVSSLRNATQEMLDAGKKNMPDAVFRRVRHILSENLRTRAAAAALREKTPDVFGKLMDESHFSLQYDFEVSCFELDTITSIARGHSACLGARMTGKGLGGSAVALLYTEADDFTDYVSKHYRQQTGRFPNITLCRATEGGRVEKLQGKI
ncbi:MAG: galactokinase [Synergistaceae bacterium]|jgi:galactokinase|nr:galactokinase [Synergistaceae bacterium]